MAISSPALDKITPVTPPTVNKNRNAIPNNKLTRKSSKPAQIVANQLNIFIPVGTAIIIVAAVK